MFCSGVGTFVQEGHLGSTPASQKLPLSLHHFALAHRLLAKNEAYKKEKNVNLYTTDVYFFAWRNSTFS